MKTIKYTILDSNISNSFTFDTEKIKTWDDLIEKFATELQIEAKDFDLENPPKDKSLNSIDETHEFKIKIKTDCSDLTFLIPSGKKIKFKQGNSLTFSKVVERFQQEHIYFSKKCQQNNLQFKIFDNILNFPLKKVPPSFVVNVFLKGDYIKLEYDERRYYFSEKETVFEAIDLIKSSFKKHATFSIKDQFKNIKYQSNHKLTKSEKYKIEIKHDFSFVHKIMTKLNSHQILDLKTKVKDIKDIFTAIYSDDRSLKADNIIIYDKDQSKVENDDTFLIDIEDSRQQITFYILGYDPTRLLGESSTEDKKSKSEPKSEPKIERNIESKQNDHNPKNETKIEKNIELKQTDYEPKSERPKSKIKKPVLKKVMTSSEIFDLKQKQEIDIEFIFREQNEKLPNKQFTEKVKRETTISELSKMICNKFNINKEISIKYKYEDNYYDIESSMTIDDVIDDIKVKTSKNKYTNILFIDILSEEKQKNKPSTKIDKKSSSSDDDDIQKNILMCSQQDEKDEENDDNDNESDDEENDDNDNESDDDVVAKPKQKSANGKCIYYYQTNKDDEVKEIELKEGANVKQFKEIIGKENDVENLADIKVIFAGKNLLNDIILDELNIGDTILFIYIRTTQDILLMTAKALQFKIEDEEDEEDEEDDDD